MEHFLYLCVLRAITITNCKKNPRFMTRNERANFGSKLGVILASAGSAVGPDGPETFEQGQRDGAAFILIYLVCVLILGIPIMIAEFLIGRRSRANTAGAYQSWLREPIVVGWDEWVY